MCYHFNKKCFSYFDTYMLLYIIYVIYKKHYMNHVNQLYRHT